MVSHAGDAAIGIYAEAFWHGPEPQPKGRRTCRTADDNLLIVTLADLNIWQIGRYELN